MVYPIESEKPSGSTLEERLAYKFDGLQLSREERNHELFDEIAKSIEILMKGLPEAYEELTALKEELIKGLNEELKSIEEEASMATDNIQREFITNQKSYGIKWEFREIYEELIMEVLQKFDLILIRGGKRSYLESLPEPAVLQPADMEPVEEQPIMQEQYQQPVPQQPMQQQYQQPQQQYVEQPQYEPQPQYPPQQQYVPQPQYPPQEAPLPTSPPREEQLKRLQKPFLHPKTKSFKNNAQKPEENFEV